MDITLVNVTTKITFDGNLVNRLSTVGIYSLIACLENAGIDIDFREYFLDFEKSPQEEFAAAEEFFSTAAQIIGIGCHSIHLPFVIRIIQIIKKIDPNKIIILGGIGPSIIAQSLMEKIKEIDVIMTGESEINCPPLVHTLLEGNRDLSTINGIIFREGEKLITTPPMERVIDLDTLPMPAYKYLDVNLYTQPMVMAARGCPFQCPFCSLSSYWSKKISFRSPERLAQELKVLADMGVQSVFFADPCFMLDKKRVEEFIRIINETVTMKEYKTYGRLDLIDEEVSSILAKGNFNAIFYGLESGSNSVLQKIKGGFTVEKGLDVIRMNQKYFSRIEVSLMWGFPFETLDDLRQTLEIHNYLKDELGCVVQLTWFQPFANTRYFDEYKETLFKPIQLSGIYDRSRSRNQLRDTFDRAGEYSYTISLRSMISHSHVYSLASDLIDNNPYLFPDFYRYQTPELEKKIALISQIVPT